MAEYLTPTEDASGQPMNLSERIRSMLAEARELGSGDYFAQVIQLRKALDGTTTSDTDTFLCPSGWNFVVHEIRPHFGFNNASTEAVPTPADTTFLSTGDLADRAMLKRMNCRVQLAVEGAAQAALQVIDTTGTSPQIPAGTATDMALSDLYDEDGKPSPIVFAEGNDAGLLVVTGNASLKLTVSLRKSSATATATAGQLALQAEYGLDVVGIFVKADAAAQRAA